MFKLGVKTINGTDYVYAQKSVYINSQKTKTRSYSLGNVKKFIADLTSKITGGWIYTYSGEICLSKIAEKIGFSECVNKHTDKLPEKSIYDLPGYLLTLVLYQILNPDSKSECMGWYQNSYIQHIINLPDELEEPINQYGKNGFRLYNLPTPKKGVVGIIGSNGIGKTTMLKILSGELNPNLGVLGANASWEEVIEKFKGREIQGYLEKLSEG